MMLLLLVSSTSFASSPKTFDGLQLQVADNRWASWPIVGQAEFTWFWFDVYRSTLRTPDGIYHGEGKTAALQIEYQRKISAQELLKATRKQWLEMDYNESLIDRWINYLTTLFPSVVKGDQLIYVSQGGQGKLYFHPVKQTLQFVGTINDTELDRAFLGIWLATNTEYPDLRLQLIGEK
ncbi:chalcone isomerase family protein [Vibrio sp. NFV-1]|uniref:Chalcone isomerase family protein n=2 Tax=Vibrio nitrifigilis TaxID=2789781 RepID=A0ABS0GEH1_9VIBR|nr:chalcone isomerase family protein [Vibrio nitrifigilis]